MHVIVKHACFNNLVWFCYTFILSETVQWGQNGPAGTDGYSPDLHFILKTINGKQAQQDTSYLCQLLLQLKRSVTEIVNAF